MFKNMLKRIVNLPTDNQGFVMMSTLAIFLFIFVICAFIYAVGETIHQRIKIQNACDAAAYSAAVVQADGLSRMATVNRAMAWSYVQMTNRQMDYITYNWLKLVHKRFGEDSANAKKYSAQLIAAFDKELGWWALVESAATGAVDILLDLDCDTGGHEKEGSVWWCGLEHGTEHSIKLNTTAGLSGAITSGVLNQIFTYDLLDDLFRDEPAAADENTEESLSSKINNLGSLLGTLIDYDKNNIQNLNNALVTINNQMNVSMKLTAENVLKMMLKDTRLGTDSSALDDYFISIHIPEGVNPYDVENRTDSPKSFFSPLHNTEADERLFLQMQSTDNYNMPLSAHFPGVLASAETAHGVDQWFIRGTGVYENSQQTQGDNYSSIDTQEGDSDSCYQAQTATAYHEQGNSSGWVSETGAGLRLLSTKRDEGALGIQRVYKDTNLNESEVSYLGSKVSRGNHILSLLDLLNAGFDAFAEFFSGSGEMGDDSDDDDDDGFVGSTDEIAAQINEDIDTLTSLNSSYNSEITQLAAEDPVANASKIAELENKVATNNELIADYTTSLSDISNVSSGDTSSSNSYTGSTNTATQSGMNVITSFFSSFLDSFLGSYVDIPPSCENSPNLDYAQFPMCEKITDTTTSLYAEYRWASCKYYCLTKLYTWTLSLLFNDSKIYCDTEKKTFKSFLTFKLRGKGYGHYGFPKWFCGNEPYEQFLDFIPPLWGDISGSNHGYMSDVLNFGSDGFLRPLDPIFSSGDCSFSRDDYHSCAMFLDGSFRYAKGSDSYAGLIRGHARIYGDDKEIFDNRYVGARCEPWVLNERYFDGEGTIVIGAAMKHTNPFVQLFNFLNSTSSEKATQENMGKTVISAFDIPDDNYMWTMSSARAGVRHRRRNGMYDQERQYQITYDATSDVENLSYNNTPIVYMSNNDGDGEWVSEESWLAENGSSDNKEFVFSRANVIDRDIVPIWNGCPCGKNNYALKNIWNLCETDWDATLIPLRYAGRKATLKLTNGSKDDSEAKPLEEFENNKERQEMIVVNYDYSESNGENQIQKNDMVFGNGESWEWQSALTQDSWTKSSNSFINMSWKKANLTFFEDLVSDAILSNLTNSVITTEDLNLQNKIPEGNEEKSINILTSIKDRIL